MAQKPAGPYNFSEVFAKELEEIRRRRRSLAVDASALEEHAGQPSSKLGIVGLALSGGGIRSATFGLGIIQGLAKRDLLRNVDYLSTVSGGGYIGSCLSSLLNDVQGDPYEPGRFPLRKDLGEPETEALVHLRNSSNYLNPGGFLGGLRLPTLILRGILINVLLFLPYIMIAVLVTKVAFYFDLFNHEYFLGASLGIGALYLLLAIAFPFVSRLFRSRFHSEKRNGYEVLLTCVFGFALAMAALVPVLLAVDQFLLHGVNFEFGGGVGGLQSVEIWVLGSIVLFSLMIVATASKAVVQVGGKIVLYTVGFLGPFAVFVVYLILCQWIVDTPYLTNDLLEEFDRAVVIEGSQSVEVETPRLPWRWTPYPAEDREELAVEETSNIRRELERKLRLNQGLGNYFKFYKYKVPIEEEPEKWVVIFPTKSIANWERAWTIQLEPDSDRLRFGDSLDIDPFDEPREWLFAFVLIVLLVVNRLFLDVNTTSVHSFYRDRLSKAYLFRSSPNCAGSNDKLKLSELNRQGTVAPYHLINAALNLEGSRQPDLRGRNAEPFLFSKHFIGSQRTSYCPTSEIERVDSQVDLGTAMAISAAAAAPNMGTMTIKPLVFVMTMLNIRLGYWLPNPRWVSSASKIDFAGPSYLLQEAMGGVDEKRRRVNVSDGGHVENLGVYELLRRRCKLVIAVDAEGDRSLSFGSLIELVRYARIDLGIAITIDLESIRDGSAHFAVGKIQYNDREDGLLFYIKASVTGDENLYISKYAVEHEDFPHQSTADQFFDETQFEAYRALGEHIAEQLPWPA